MNFELLYNWESNKEQYDKILESIMITNQVSFMYIQDQKFSFYLVSKSTEKGYNS